ncbi:MAG TPA: guanylate kinase [Blastocatellia bacterium]|jgi:guanylate kinase|nr:guanylate kinase [Blastocatellia bacterium]
MWNEGRPVNGDAAEPVGRKSRSRTYATERGNLIVVSAPSGAGKSSLVQRALKKVTRLKYSISYTTRTPRGAEEHGVDYFFVSEADFLRMRERGEFLESAEVHGYFYGTHRATVEAMLDKGFDVILDIDVQGAEQILLHMPESVTVFIMPPTKKILESRLRARNLNAPDDLERRLRNATAEVRLYDRFDYVIINEIRDRAFGWLKAIIIAERRRPGRQKKRLQSIIATFGGE